MTIADLRPEWLSAVLPLGALVETNWTPIGAGVLVMEHDLVWLLTSRSALDRAEGAHVAALVGRGEQSQLFDLTAGHTPHDLGWLRHEDLDLAAALFPVDPAWGIKAFSPGTCLHARDVSPLLATATVSFPYGGTPRGETPPALLLDGTLSGGGGQRLYSTSPVSPHCGGGPLLVITAPPSLGGVVLLAGIVSHEIALREGSGLVPAALTAPSVRLSVAHPIDAALELIRSEAAQAQRERVQGA